MILLLVLATIALLLIWGGSFLLAAFEVDVPLSLQVGLSVVVVVAVVVTVVLRRVRAQRRAKQLEAEILKQSELQAATARPDRRAEILELQKRVQAGIAALKDTKIGKHHGRSALYALPWYAIIGPPGAGKTTALKHSGLVFPFQDPSGQGGVRGVGGTRNCDWWFTNEGILLDTAGRYATDDSDRDEWFAFLGMLRKHRPEKPINGLLVAIAVSDLFDATDEQISGYARKLRARVDEIMTRLDMVLPVYVVFTKVDLVGGFVEFWGDLRKSDRDQILGATFPLDGSNAAEPGKSFGLEFDRVVSSVTARAIRVIGKEPQPDQRAKIFQFPLEFKALRGNLEQFCDELFRQNAFQENPLFRGFYFTSGTQEGKPLERIMGNMARALGIRQPPSLKQPSESKSYFVTDVFRKVVFPDQDVAGRTAQELKRQRLLRGIIAAAAAAIGALILVPAIGSFVKNKELIRNSEAASAAAAAVPWGNAEPARPKVATLDEARKYLMELDRYRDEGPPISLRWGMYEGDVVYGGLRDAYVGHLHRGMVGPAQKQLDFDLAAIGMAAGVQSSQYGKMYDRVKLYVMLTHPVHLDVDWAVAQLTRVWSQLLRDESAETVAAMTPHVRYYLDLLKRGEAAPWPLTEKTLARARSVLLRAPSIERTYEVLVREANEHVAAITKESIFYGSVAPYVESKRGLKVDGVYTREGWERVRKLLGTEKSRLTDEYWVLGEEGAGDKDVASQIAKLRKLYFDRFVNAWKMFLADLDVARPKEALSALDELSALSEPEWPYLRLLRTLAENTALEEETSEQGLLEKVKEKAEEKVEQLAAKAQGQPQTSKSPARPRTPPETAFLPLTQFAVPADGVDSAATGLSQYMAVVAKLIGVMSDLRDADTPSRTDKLEQEFETAFRATSSLLSTQDGFTRPLLAPLLLHPIMGAWSGVTRDVGSAAGGLWEVSVWEEFRSKLEPNYPIAQTSMTDAKLDDFANFFRPETGVLWGFYKENLSSQIRRSGVTFAPVRRFDSKVEFVPDFLSNCLGRGAKISEAFFGNGSEPKMDFQVNLHSVSPNVAEVSLDIDGAKHVYKNTPEEWLVAAWPSKEGTPGARVRIRGAAGLDEEIIRDGEFGLFRLLAAAKNVTPGTAGGLPGGVATLVATFDFPSEKAFLKLDVRSKQGLEVLSPELLRDYKCPRIITSPTN